MPLGSRDRSAAVVVVLIAVGVAGMLGLNLVPTGAASAGGLAGSARTVLHGFGAAPSHSADRWSEPLRPLARSSSWTPPGVPHPTVSPAIAWFNNSSCDPNWPANTPVGVGSIDASVTWTGNTSGTAPLTIGWSLNISGGGIPPYQTVVDFEMTPAIANSPNSTSGNGSITLTVPGLYYGVAAVIDSTCDADSAAYLSPITVYPSTGDPLQLSANVTAGPAPLAVNYSVNASRLPANSSVVWESPTAGPGTLWANANYYEAGDHNASACVLNATGTWLACGASPVVNVTSSVITTAATVGNGTEPVNVTYWVNVTNGSLLPSGWTVYLTLDNGTILIAHSQNSTTTGTESFGCGPGASVSPPNNLGECAWVASWMVLVPTAGGLVASGSIWANVSEAGSPAVWFPAVTYSLSPTNGSAPLNVTLNLSAANAVAPYSYWWAVFGASSGLANRTFYPTLSGNGTGWNGSAISIVIPLTRTGLYMVTATVGDADHALVFVYPRVITAGVPLVPVPLVLTTTESAPANASGLAEVRFSVSATGGSGPYTVEWNFGDGSFGSSLLGSPVEHTYRSAGTYDPSVTVTDGSGHAVASRLGPVTVAASVPSNPGHGGGSGTGAPGSGRSGGPSIADPGWPGGLAAAALTVGAVAVVVTLLAVVSVRRDRDAADLARTLESDAGATPRDR